MFLIFVKIKAMDQGIITFSENHYLAQYTITFLEN